MTKTCEEWSKSKEFVGLEILKEFKNENYVHSLEHSWKYEPVEKEEFIRRLSYVEHKWSFPKL